MQAGFRTATQQQSREARRWFRERAEKIRGVNVNRIMTDTPSRLFSRGSREDIGSMLMFFYDAKLKEELPYWDQFPCAMPFHYYTDAPSFLSINFHYLPMDLRARLFNALYTTAQKEKNKIKKLQIDYGLLKKTGHLWRPCVKRHLFSQMKSRMFYVRPEEWDMCLFLPTARFVGASQREVWDDSQRIITRSRRKGNRFR